MQRLLSVLGAVALALTLVACDNSDPAGPDGFAALRVAHLSPDAPAVDVYVDDVKVVSAAPFRAVTDHLGVEAGERRIRVMPAGATSPVVIDATLNFSIGQSSTVAATGLLGADDLEPIVLADQRSAPSGEVRVRFVHASPDAPAVDVAVAGGSVLFGNVSFREDEPYLTVAPGTYNLQVRLAGTSTVALSVPGVVLSGGRSYTIFAVGLAGNSTLAALAVAD
jgi:hypothetical protein